LPTADDRVLSVIDLLLFHIENSLGSQAVKGFLKRITMTKTTCRSLLVLVLLASVVATSNAFVGFPRGVSSASDVSTTTAARTQGWGKSTSTSSSRSTRLLKSSTATATASSKDGNNEVVIDKDFRLAGAFLSLGLLLDTIPWIQLTLGPLVTLLGVLFLVQSFRLNFVCDNEAFQLQMGSVKSVGENILVGGDNRWDYDKFVNYDFFPKGWIDQPQGPILVYFKENQTPSDKWNEGPGKSANSAEALAKGSRPGQVHFFPALCNTKQLRAEWEKRGCNKME
jgi:hypothetical protein